jgi:predicted O-methyltransferase YrrM
LHDIITTDLWEREFEEIVFEGNFPPTNIYPDEVGRVNYALTQLAAKGLIADSVCVVSTFEETRAAIHDRFNASWTAISRPMERFLFAVAAKMQPRVTCVVGCGWGIAVAYLAAALQAVNSSCAHHPHHVIGVDSNQSTVEIARANLDVLGINTTQVELIAEDGHIFLEGVGDQIDLLILDADGPPDGPATRCGKRIYETLLSVALPRLRTGKVVMAHDVRWASISGEIDGYLSIVRDPAIFSKSVEVRLDIQGIEMSRR